MALNINQFGMTQVQGAPDLQFNGSVISGQVEASQATAIVAGQALKLVDNASPIPQFLAATANTDKIFGFALRNLKDPSFEAGERLEVAMGGTVMYMTAGAAIVRGKQVEIVFGTVKVITYAGVNTIVGYALDKAAADGDLIRVFIAGFAGT